MTQRPNNDDIGTDVMEKILDDTMKEKDQIIEHICKYCLTIYIFPLKERTCDKCLDIKQQARKEVIEDVKKMIKEQYKFHVIDLVSRDIILEELKKQLGEGE
jgi:uncharacterized protein YwgA